MERQDREQRKMKFLEKHRKSNVLTTISLDRMDGFSGSWYALKVIDYVEYAACVSFVRGVDIIHFAYLSKLEAYHSKLQVFLVLYPNFERNWNL